MKKLVTYNSGFTVAELLAVLMLWLAIPLSWLFIGGLWTQSNLSFWLTYFKHTPVHVPYLLAVACNILAPLAFLGDIVMSLARLFVA